MRRKRKKKGQLALMVQSLGTGGRGGRRRGAGRPRVRKPGYVRHDPRPEHKKRDPLHVVLKLRPELPPCLREPLYAAAVAGALRLTEKTFFRVTAFSMQDDHLHLICEADSKDALTRGMQGLAIRVARAINKTMGREGKVWRERYHATRLRSPRQTRNALVYVLNNGRKHGVHEGAIDLYSSARWFWGYAKPPPPPTTPRPCAEPTIWMLKEGWLKAGGPIRADERPKSAPHD